MTHRALQIPGTVERFLGCEKSMFCLFKWDTKMQEQLLGMSGGVLKKHLLKMSSCPQLEQNCQIVIALQRIKETPRHTPVSAGIFESRMS